MLSIANPSVLHSPRVQPRKSPAASPPAAGGLRILVADGHPEARQTYQQVLPRLGHQVQLAGTEGELIEACRLLRPDLVMAAAQQADLDGLSAAEAVCRERPVPFVLVTDGRLPDCGRLLAADNVVACLPRPLEEGVLAAALPLAVSRFEQLRLLRAEVADLRQALDERKVIERAKESVARRLGVPECEAYQRLRATASRSNRKLIEVASQVLAAEGVFAGLDERRTA